MNIANAIGALVSGSSQDGSSNARVTWNSEPPTHLGPFVLPGVLAENMEDFTGLGLTPLAHIDGASVMFILDFMTGDLTKVHVESTDGPLEFEDPDAWARWCAERGLMSAQELARARRDIRAAT